MNPVLLVLAGLVLLKREQPKKRIEPVVLTLPEPQTTTFDLYLPPQQTLQGAVVVEKVKSVQVTQTAAVCCSYLKAMVTILEKSGLDKHPAVIKRLDTQPDFEKTVDRMNEWADVGTAVLGKVSGGFLAPVGTLTGAIAGWLSMIYEAGQNQELLKSANNTLCVFWSFVRELLGAPPVGLFHMFTFATEELTESEVLRPLDDYSREGNPWNAVNFTALVLALYKGLTKQVKPEQILDYSPKKAKKANLNGEVHLLDDRNFFYQKSFQQNDFVLQGRKIKPYFFDAALLYSERFKNCRSLNVIQKKDVKKRSAQIVAAYLKAYERSGRNAVNSSSFSVQEVRKMNAALWGDLSKARYQSPAIFCELGIDVVSDGKMSTDVSAIWERTDILYTSQRGKLYPGLLS